MSKAPSGNVKEYEGDGDWFKIWEQTLCNEKGDLTTDAWCTYGDSQFEFKIPENSPAVSLASATKSQVLCYSCKP